jgi:PAS domain S-box-containing protein
MKSFLDRQVRLAFGFALLTLLLAGTLSYRWMGISDESALWIRHTRNVLESIQDLNLVIERIDSASRVFAFTGQESDLDDYSASVSKAEQDLTFIRNLTVDNPMQQLRIASIETLAAKRIQHANTVIKLRRDLGIAAASAAVRSEGDDSTKHEFQAIAGTMRDAELRLLALRRAETEHDQSRTRVILILGTLIGMLIVGLAARSALAESRRRETVEGALRDSEERHRLLLDGVQDYAIFMLDSHGLVTSWSASAERIKGYTAEEILGHSFSCFFLPEDIERNRPEDVLRIAETMGRHEEFGMRVRKDGSEFLASVTFIAMHDKDGNLRGFSEICRDLSDHKESEARYRGLLEAAPDGMVVVNQAGKIVLLNVHAEKQFRYRRDELIGQNVTNIIPVGFAEWLISDGTGTIAEALAQQMGTGIELIGLRKDGTGFPVEIMLSPIESPEGMLVTAAIRDITVRKDAEKRLAQMEGRYRGLLEAAPDGMVVVNQGGDIVLLNAQAEKQFGYRRDELLGQNVKNIIPEGFAERLIADALRTTAEALAQQIGTGIELYGRRKDGTEFPIEIMLSPLESAEGILVTAAIRDISERKQLASQLRQSQKMEAIGQLTGGIAHDFNNLLAIVIGNLGLLERMIEGNEAALKRLKPAQKAAARGADLTRRLLGLASKEDLNPVSVRLEEAIQETIELAGRALGPEIKILTNFDLSVSTVFVDVAGLESALLNLAVNARDAMPKGGTLTIGTQLSHLDESFPPVQIGELKSGAYARISVSDTGDGMSRETLDRALEPFFTTKTRNKGTGLGLAMVYGFARQSGGTVRLYSEQGYGTTVSLYLPLAGDAAPATPELPAAHVSNHSGGTVLVVDDEVELLEIAHEYLTEMGYSALRANNAASALKTIAEDGEIDLMITDIIMPGGMNGVELAEKARLLSPRLKVIYSSGFPADALVERNGTKVDDPMLRKPYQRSEFAAIIRRTLAGTTI